MLDVGELSFSQKRPGLPLNRDADGRQQSVAGDRLDQEIDGTRLHRLNYRRCIGCTRYEYDRPINAILAQDRLQLSSINLGHQQIDHKTTWCGRVMLGKKLLGRGECARSIARSTDKT